LIRQKLDLRTKLIDNKPDLVQRCLTLNINIADYIERQKEYTKDIKRIDDLSKQIADSKFLDITKVLIEQSKEIQDGLPYDKLKENNVDLAGAQAELKKIYTENEHVKKLVHIHEIVKNQKEEVQTIDNNLNKQLGIPVTKSRSSKFAKTKSNQKPGKNIFDLTIIKEDENEGADSDRKSVNVLQPGAALSDCFKTSLNHSARSNQDYEV